MRHKCCGRMTWSDDVGGGSGDEEACEEETLMGRIIVERDEWLDSLSAGAGAAGGTPLRGSVVDAAGQRRWTRRVRKAPLKQDFFTPGNEGSGR